MSLSMLNEEVALEPMQIVNSPGMSVVKMGGKTLKFGGMKIGWKIDEISGFWQKRVKNRILSFLLTFL